MTLAVLRLPVLRSVGATSRALAASVAVVSAEAWAEAPRLPEVVVTAGRSEEPLASLAKSVSTLPITGRSGAPAASLDEALRGVPAFALFRRPGSLVANPTTQGVSLRGLGPSGASRALVLWEGVPLNDPFGGWVSWSLLSRGEVGRIEVVPGGASDAWGGSALAGVVQVLAPEVDGGKAGVLSVQAGSRAWLQAEAEARAGSDGVRAEVGARWQDYGGAPVVRGEDRGAVDEAAGSRHTLARATVSGELAGGTDWSVSARAFDEERDNGTPLQRNATRLQVLTARLRGGEASGAGAWNLGSFVRLQEFTQSFSAVAAGRATETPASEQFSVPATALGLDGGWRVERGADVVSVSADARGAEAESCEDFLWNGTRYTRRREAGGAQGSAGLGARWRRAWTDDGRWSSTLGARGDVWRNADGRRREWERASGRVLRDDAIPDRSDFELSPSAGVVWQATGRTSLHVSAQRSFRVPTLNELHRPFRAGSVVTESNPALGPERALGGELGVRTGAGPVVVAAALFANELEDAVANVTVARGPGVFPDFGSLGAGVTGRRRLALDRVEHRGGEISAEWVAASWVRFEGGWQIVRTRVGEAAVAPGLVGRELAQVPRHTVTGACVVSPAAGWEVALGGRWTSAAWEDDENTLRLAPGGALDASVRWRPGAEWSLWIACDNVTGAELVAGRSVDGVVAATEGRRLRAGVEWSW